MSHRKDEEIEHELNEKSLKTEFLVQRESKVLCEGGIFCHGLHCRKVSHNLGRDFLRQNRKLYFAFNRAYVGTENTHLCGMGKYHCTVDLLFDWFGFSCFANVNQQEIYRLVWSNPY